MTTKFLKVIIFSACFVLLAACSLPDGDVFGRIPEDRDRRHFRWCNQGEPGTIDPAVASSTMSSPIVSLGWDALMTYGMDGLPVPSLATDVEQSEDLKTFTFHMRRDATWSNGRGVTAYDIAYTAFRVLHPMVASPNADNLAPIENATAYLERKVFVLQRDAGPYKAGDVVTSDEAFDPNRRTSSAVLALRDLGAAESAAYARVPAGQDVFLFMRCGERATLPCPGEQRWAYVIRAGEEDAWGWVPEAELDGVPDGDRPVAVRRGKGPAVTVTARDLAITPGAVGIDIPDPYTIVFHCSDPTPFFLPLADNRALRSTPIEAVSRSPRRWTEPPNVVTSGPMQLVEWRDRDKMEFVRSPTYWNQAEIGIDRLTAYSIEDQAANTNFYYSGGCDATSSNTVPSTYLPALNGEQRGRAYKDYVVSPYLGVYFLWVNTQKLTNRHLRRALALAIDRRPIPQFTHGGEYPTAQLTPGTPIAQLSDADLAACGVSRDRPGVALVMTAGELCYVPPLGLDFDLAAAKAELELARREMGAAFPATLHYRYNSGSEAHKQIAEYVQAAWQALGLDVEIEAQEFNSLLADTRSGDYEIARLGNIGNVADTESEFLPLLRCGSPDNRGKYCNSEYERLMDEARPLRDRKARNAVLAKAEQVAIEDAPLIPIYVYTQKHLVKPYVKDFAINLIDQPPLWRVRLE